MLKKIVLTIAAVAAVASLSGQAFAAFALIDAVPGLNFKTSTNVKVAYETDTGKQNYAIMAKHTSGDTFYATSNISTNIVKATQADQMGKVLLGTATIPTGTTAPVAGESSFTTKGWAAM